MATGTSGITIYSDIVNQYFNGIDTTNFTKTKSLAQAPTKANIETIVTDLGATSRTLEVSNKNSVTQNSYTNEQCVLFTNLISNYYYYYYYKFINGSTPVDGTYQLKSGNIVIYSGSTISGKTDIHRTTEYAELSLTFTPTNKQYMQYSASINGQILEDKATDPATVQTIAIGKYNDANLSVSKQNIHLYPTYPNQSVTDSVTVSGIRVSNAVISVSGSNSTIVNKLNASNLTTNFSGNTVSTQSIVISFSGATVSEAGNTYECNIIISGTDLNTSNKIETSIVVNISPIPIGDISYISGYELTDDSLTIPYSGLTDNIITGFYTNYLPNGLDLSYTVPSWAIPDGIFTLDMPADEEYYLGVDFPANTNDENPTAGVYTCEISGRDYYDVLRTKKIIFTQLAPPSHGTITIGGVPSSLTYSRQNLSVSITASPEIIGNLTVSVNAGTVSKRSIPASAATSGYTIIWDIPINNDYGKPILTRTITVTGTDAVGHTITAIANTQQEWIGDPEVSLSLNETAIAANSTTHLAKDMYYFELSYNKIQNGTISITFNDSEFQYFEGWDDYTETFDSLTNLRTLSWNLDSSVITEMITPGINIQSSGITESIITCTCEFTSFNGDIMAQEYTIVSSEPEIRFAPTTTSGVLSYKRYYYGSREYYDIILENTFSGTVIVQLQGNYISQTVGQTGATTPSNNLSVYLPILPATISLENETISPNTNFPQTYTSRLRITGITKNTTANVKGIQYALVYSNDMYSKTIFIRILQNGTSYLSITSNKFNIPWSATTNAFELTVKGDDIQGYSGGAVALETNVDYVVLAATTIPVTSGSISGATISGTISKNYNNTDRTFTITVKGKNTSGTAISDSVIITQKACNAEGYIYTQRSNSTQFDAIYTFTSPRGYYNNEVINGYQIDYAAMLPLITWKDDTSNNFKAEYIDNSIVELEAPIAYPQYNSTFKCNFGIKNTEISQGTTAICDLCVKTKSGSDYVLPIKFVYNNTQGGGGVGSGGVSSTSATNLALDI